MPSPLKYAVKDGVTTLKVDKEMMMPYMPLITSLVDAFLPDGDIEVSLDPESDPMKIPAKALVNSLLDALFNQSQSIEIGIGPYEIGGHDNKPFPGRLRKLRNLLFFLL